MLIVPTLYLRASHAIHPAGSQASNVALDPVALAAAWSKAGVHLIHVVDLDIPPTGGSVHEPIVREIIEKFQLAIQIEGPFKSLDTIERYMGLGCERIVLGTIAYQRPDFLERVTEKFPNRVAVHLDVRGGKVQIKGWMGAINKKGVEFYERFKKSGVSTILYSEVEDDGTITDHSLHKMKQFLSDIHLTVICSSDPTDLKQIEGLLRLEKFGLTGIQFSHSIYENRIDLGSVIHFVENYSIGLGDEETLIPD